MGSVPHIGASGPTQLAHARAGIVTPEREPIAIREDLGRAQMADAAPRDGEPFLYEHFAEIREAAEQGVADKAKEVREAGGEIYQAV